VSDSPAGVAAGTIVQARPSHRSINAVPRNSGAMTDAPTAKQLVALAHDTPSNSLEAARVFGLGRMVQPFSAGRHCALL
jgi:hypothetical protein